MWLSKPVARNKVWIIEESFKTQTAAGLIFQGSEQRVGRGGALSGLNQFSIQGRQKTHRGQDPTKERLRTMQDLAMPHQCLQGYPLLPATRPGKPHTGRPRYMARCPIYHDLWASKPLAIVANQCAWQTGCSKLSCAVVYSLQHFIVLNEDLAMVI